MDIMETFNTNLGTVEKAVKNFPWTDPKSYVQFLSQTYYYVKHSTPLLGRALRKMDSTSEADMKGRFLDHTKEEKGHQYLVVDDLKFFGLTTESIPEYPETVAFYKLQYDYINQNGPTSLFGYILQLEGTAWKYGDNICSAIIKTFGPEAAHFMKVHSGNEIEHVESALKMIRGLSPEQIVVNEENFIKSCDAYAKLLERAKIEGQKSLITLKSA